MGGFGWGGRGGCGGGCLGRPVLRRGSGCRRGGKWELRLEGWRWLWFGGRSGGGEE